MQHGLVPQAFRTIAVQPHAIAVASKEHAKRLFADSVFRYQCFKSRQRAHRLRERIVAKRGFSIVDTRLRREIRAYSRSAFGSASFWPWLAVYAEVRCSFVRGWIPNELLTHRLFPRANPVDIAHVSLYKTLDYRLFGEACVRPLLIFAGRHVYDSDFMLIDVETARRVLREHDAEVVIKRDGGSGGDDVFFVQARDLDPERYLGRESWVVQPAVRQHDSLAQVYPHSINTIRIVTAIDGHAEVRVLFSLLRMGIDGSRVDNTAQGGRFLYLDGEGRALTDAVSDLGVEFEDCHPTTGYPYREIAIPQFAQARRLCIGAHHRFPFAGIVGWDVFIDTSGHPRLLEWNARLPYYWMNEPYMGPLWDVDDPRLRRVFPGDSRDAHG